MLVLCTSKVCIYGGPWGNILVLEQQLCQTLYRSTSLRYQHKKLCVNIRPKFPIIKLLKYGAASGFRRTEKEKSIIEVTCTIYEYLLHTMSALRLVHIIYPVYIHVALYKQLLTPVFDPTDSDHLTVSNFSILPPVEVKGQVKNETVTAVNVVVRATDCQEKNGYFQC